MVNLKSDLLLLTSSLPPMPFMNLGDENHQSSFSFSLVKKQFTKINLKTSDENAKIVLISGQ